MKLRDVCKFTTKGLNFAKGRNVTIISDFYEPAIYGNSSSWYYITMSCVKDNYIGELYSFEENRDYVKYAIRDGDIIICKLGPYYRSAIYDNAFPFADPDEVKSKITILVTENIYILGLDKEKVDPYYVAYFLSLEETKEKIDKFAKGERTKYVRVEDILELELPKYSDEMRKKTEDFRKKLMEMGKQHRLQRIGTHEKAKRKLGDIFDDANDILVNAMENEKKNT